VMLDGKMDEMDLCGGTGYAGVDAVRTGNGKSKSGFFASLRMTSESRDKAKAKCGDSGCARMTSGLGAIRKV